MGFQDNFDFPGKDVFPTANEHVVIAADKVIKPSLILAENVASHVVAVCGERACQVRSIVITQHQSRAADLEHALAGWVAVIVGQPELNLRVGIAH